MPFSIPLIPGRFANDLADPHDTISKLRAHANSATKIGNHNEAKAFHAKADDMVKKHGELKVTKVTGSPSSPYENGYEQDTSWAPPYPPHSYKATVIRETFRRHGFRPAESRSRGRDMSHMNDHPNPDGTPRKRGDAFRGLYEVHNYIHPAGHTAQYVHGHIKPEQKHISHEYSVTTKKGKKLEGSTPEQLEHHLTSEGVKGKPISHKTFHGTSDPTTSPGSSWSDYHEMYKRHKEAGEFAHQEPRGLAKPGALTNQSRE